MSNNVPITNGTGTSSVAAEEIGTAKYQQIKVVGGEVGSTSVLGVNPDRSINVSVIGVVQTTGSVALASGFISVMSLLPALTSFGADNQSILEEFTTAGALGTPPGGASNYVFNGSNWDRLRGNSSIGALVNMGTGSVITRWADSSVIARVTGSVATVFQGSVLTIPTGSVITVFQSSSIIGVVTGSVSAIIRDPGSGTGTEVRAAQSDGLSNNTAALATAALPNVFNGTNWERQRGNSSVGAVVSTGIRNDTLSSIYSTDGAAYRAAFGPAGEQIVANAPLTKWVRGTADMRGVGALGGSVTVISAQGASIFTYVTSAQFVNIGGASVLVTIAGGLGSTLGYTIAPAGGGSNIYYPNALKTGENSAVTASISGVASILVSLQGFIAKI
jgi:hypothetical protein